MGCIVSASILICIDCAGCLILLLLMLTMIAVIMLVMMMIVMLAMITDLQVIVRLHVMIAAHRVLLLITDSHLCLWPVCCRLHRNHRVRSLILVHVLSCSRLVLVLLLCRVLLVVQHLLIHVPGRERAPDLRRRRVSRPT